MERLNNQAVSFITQQLQIKAPRQDDHEMTPASRLLERRREMQDVEYGLSKQRDDYSIKMESISQRNEELARKESQLKESLVKFDKYLAENDGKKLRAMRKAIEEKSVRGLKESELTQLTSLSERLVAIKRQQLKAIEANSLFHNYLESMLELNEEYVEVKDIVARYDTLRATNAELIKRAQQAQEQTEENKQEFAAFLELQNNKHLNFNNQIARKHSKLEEYKMESAKKQFELDKIVRSATSKSLMLGQIKMASNNLFTIIKGHLNHRLNTTNDTMAQLDALGFFITDLNEIVNDQK